MNLLKAEEIKKGVYKIETRLVRPIKTPDYKYFIKRKTITNFIIDLFGTITTSAYSIGYEDNDRYLILDTNENFYD